MKFSVRTLYGLKAVLVLAGRYGEGSLSVSQIATKEGISVPYLEQILNALKKSGFVKSVRGPQGGYILAKKPAEIPAKAVIGALVEKKEPKTGAGASVTSESGEATLASAIFWDRLNRSIRDGLADVTLKTLIDEARTLKKSKSRQTYTFHI